MKTVLFWIFFCLSLVLMVVQLYQQINYEVNRNRKSNLATPAPEPLDLPIVFESSQLIVERTKSWMAPYKGKTIQLQVDVERRIDAKTFATKAIGATIICEYDPKGAPEGNSLKDGEWITVTGRVTGWIADQITLSSCRFAPRTTPLYDGWEVIPRK